VTPQSLFPESEQQRGEALDQEIVRLIHGQPGGPFEQCLSGDEQAVLSAIRFHRGAKNAVTIREMRSRLQLSDREIKGIVRALRISWHLPIGSSKDSVDGGYFLILSAEDQEVFDANFLDQIRAQVQAHRCVSGPARTRELLGQLSLEVAK